MLFGFADSFTKSGMIDWPFDIKNEPEFVSFALFVK